MASRRLPAPTKERLNIAAAAAGDVESLLRMLARERTAESDSQAFERTLAYALRRLAELNSVISSVLNDDVNRPSRDMAAVVFGEREAPQ